VVAPLFAAAPRATVEGNAAAATVFLDLPVEGWSGPFAQEDRHGRAFAVDYRLAEKLFREALAGDGVWTQLFDPAAVRGRDEPAPVEAVLVALAAESRAGTNLASPHHGP
jgi:hypothetical protein